MAGSHDDPHAAVLAQQHGSVIDGILKALQGIVGQRHLTRNERIGDRRGIQDVTDSPVVEQDEQFPHLGMLDVDILISFH